MMMHTGEDFLSSISKASLFAISVSLNAICKMKAFEYFIWQYSGNWIAGTDLIVVIDVESVVSGWESVGVVSYLYGNTQHSNGLCGRGNGEVHLTEIKNNSPRTL